MEASQVALVKNSPARARDTGYMGSIPGSGRSPGGGNGNVFQYSCLESPMDRRAWRAIVHRITKSQAWLKWLSMHTSAYYIATDRSKRELLNSSQGRYQGTLIWCEMEYIPGQRILKTRAGTNVSFFLSNWITIALQYCKAGIVSAIYQPESVMGIHMPLPFWTSFLPSTPSHPSRLSQSTRFELPAPYSKFPLNRVTLKHKETDQYNITQQQQQNLLGIWES